MDIDKLKTISNDFCKVNSAMEIDVVRDTASKQFVAKINAN